MKNKKNVEVLLTGLKTFLKTNYQVVGIFILLLLFSLNYFSSQTKTPVRATESPDTYIPAGFVLVPIEIINKDALQSMFGNVGVVDLYVPSLVPGKLGRKVASRVKALRAPLNPEEFAVLVPENDASQLVHNENGFFIVIQNPHQRGTRIVKPSKNKNRISYEEG